MSFKTPSPPRVLMLCKYPPIQGGVARFNYWLAHDLAQRGCEVHVVTNARETPVSRRVFLTSDDDARLETEYGPGRVRVHWTTEGHHAHQYIPYANPFVSKLAGRALEVIEEAGIEVIWSSYFEPFGVAASLASRGSGVPYTVLHAGSDIGYLAQIPGRARIYQHVLREADTVFASNRLVSHLVSAGVEPSSTISALPRYFPTDLFQPEGEAFDVDRFVSQLEGTPFSSPRIPDRAFDPGRPTIGIYGKVGVAKGSFALVRALARLRDRGRAFNLLALNGVEGTGAEAMAREIEQRGLESDAWLLPFIPHWRVPRFIRRCDVVCFLENRFPIAIHTPSVPLEVTQCGTVLVVSREIVDKQRNASAWSSGHNCIVVEDPEDLDELCAALDGALTLTPEARGHIGREGTRLGALRDPDHARQRVVDTLRAVADRGELGMAMEDFQRALTRIYTEPAFREAVRERGEHVEEVASLAPEERDALLGLLLERRGTLERFNDALLDKKLGFYEGLFVLTYARLDPEHKRALAERFRERFDFARRSLTEEIESHGRFLEANLEQLGDRFAAELGRFETHYRILSFAVEGEPSWDRINAPREPPVARTDDPAALPEAVVLARHCRFDRFSYRFDRFIEQGASDPGPAEPVVLGLVKDFGAATTRLLRLSPALGLVLEEAGEAVAVEPLVARVRDRLQRQGTSAGRQAVLGAIAKLWSAGMLDPAPTGA